MTTPLIKRMEKAAEGSRELDRDLAKLIDKEVWGKCANLVSQSCGAQPKTIDRAALRWLPDYTTSIDAALALAERVLPGWEWLLRTDEERGFMLNCWRKGDEPNMGDACFPSYAATPALALCIAILKANHKDKP